MSDSILGLPPSRLVECLTALVHGDDRAALRLFHSPSFVLHALGFPDLDIRHVFVFRPSPGDSGAFEPVLCADDLPSSFSSAVFRRVLSCGSLSPIRLRVLASDLDAAERILAVGPDPFSGIVPRFITRGVPARSFLVLSSPEDLPEILFRDLSRVRLASHLSVSFDSNSVRVRSRHQHFSCAIPSVVEFLHDLVNDACLPSDVSSLCALSSLARHGVVVSASPALRPRFFALRGLSPALIDSVSSSLRVAVVPFEGACLVATDRIRRSLSRAGFSVSSDPLSGPPWCIVVPFPCDRGALFDLSLSLLRSRAPWFLICCSDLSSSLSFAVSASLAPCLACGALRLVPLPPGREGFARLSGLLLRWLSLPFSVPDLAPSFFDFSSSSIYQDPSCPSCGVPYASARALCTLSMRTDQLHVIQDEVSGNTDLHSPQPFIADACAAHLRSQVPHDLLDSSPRPPLSFSLGPLSLLGPFRVRSLSVLEAGAEVNRSVVVDVCVRSLDERLYWRALALRGLFWFRVGLPDADSRILPSFVLPDCRGVLYGRDFFSDLVMVLSPASAFISFLGTLSCDSSIVARQHPLFSLTLSLAWAVADTICAELPSSSFRSLGRPDLSSPMISSFLLLLRFLSSEPEIVCSSMGLPCIHVVVRLTDGPCSGMRFSGLGSTFDVACSDALRRASELVLATFGPLPVSYPFPVSDLPSFSWSFSPVVLWPSLLDCARALGAEHVIGFDLSLPRAPERVHLALPLGPRFPSLDAVEVSFFE